MASVTTQKMRSIDTLVDQLVGDGSYPRSNGTTIKEQCKQVVNNLLHLAPLKGTFTTNTGEVQTLLKLEGVVPTEFQGVTYQTPIELWIPQNFPAVAPLIYVRPTPSMAVSHGHKHVDMSGLVHIPALSQWSPSESQAVFAIMEMCSIFSALPPLRARPTRPAVAAHTEPPVGTSFGLGPSHRPSHGVAVAMGASPGSYTPAAATGGYGTSAIPPPGPATGAAGPGSSIIRQHSMESEVEKTRYRGKVTAKVQAEMAAVLAAVGREVDTEYELQAGLDATAQKLARHKAALAAHTAALVAHEADLGAHVDTISLRVAQSEGKTVTPETAPGMVRPSDVLSQQLLKTVAEAAAIEDAFLVLSKAVEEGVLPVDVFVRECRRRARRQFELKALAKTIHAAQAQAYTVVQPRQHTMGPVPGYASGGSGAQQGAPHHVAHHAPHHSQAGPGMVYHTGGVGPGREQEWVVVSQPGHAPAPGYSHHK